MATEVKTEHPHIVRTEGIRNGRPCIKGSPVHIREGADIEAILADISCDLETIGGQTTQGCPNDRTDAPGAMPTGIRVG